MLLLLRFRPSAAFVSCISWTLINLLPSTTANETLAQCLPLGHRQLQVPAIQCWSWIADKLFCHVSVATIHQPVILIVKEVLAVKEVGIFSVTASYLIIHDVWSCAAHCGVQSTASCLALNCGFSSGTWDQKQNLKILWPFVKEGTICDKFGCIEKVKLRG